MPNMMKTLNNISRCQSVFRTMSPVAEDLCAAHHTFVFAICRNPGRSQEELAREICLNKSTVARTLTYLEEHGYVTRKPNLEDKRQFLVYPTEKMLAVLPQVRAIAEEWNKLITTGIPEDKLQVFYSVLLDIEERAKTIISSKAGDVK